MKSIKHIALCFAAATMALSSCMDSFLDKAPDERVNIKTEDQVIKLMRTCYPTAGWQWICELSSDNLMDNNAPHLPASPNVEQVVTHYNLSAYDRTDDELYRFEPGKTSTSQDTPAFLWEGMYASIQQADLALQYIEEIRQENGGVLSESMKASQAEAKLIRAYCHFILVNVFSQAYKNEEASSHDIGVPYVYVAQDHVVEHYDRSTVTETYRKIEQDLLEGLANISDINYEQPKWYFNVNAAHAFAARFYLMKRDYDKVIEHANFVLTTDPAKTSTMLMDYSHFDECTYSSDYAREWQKPEQPNNLMIIDYMSLIFRHGLGNRYAQNGEKVREIFYHNHPCWRSWVVNPTAYVSGMTFWTGEDYGYCSGKVAEEFEYTDKIAGIGYVHSISREFTCTKLLLERAEAYIMKGELDLGLQDLQLYFASCQTFSEANTKFWISGGKMAPLTQDIIDSYYTNPNNPNCFENWNFTQNMSSDFVVSAEQAPLMNCLNDCRRFETAWEGLRFFDLKRWGVEYSHIIGPLSEEIKLTWNDPRRAVEVPIDAIMAGLESSRPVTLSSDHSSLHATTQPKAEDYIIFK